MIFTIFIFLAVLSLLIFVHELGHFLAAKKAGVRVEEFGFGLPPRIYGKKIGGTLYSLNLLPIGGFIRMAGEEMEMALVGDPFCFFTKSPLKKALIIVSGVIGNFLLGWLLFTVLFVVGMPVFSERAVIVSVEANSSARQAGLEVNDVLLALDDQSVNYSWEVTDYVKNHQKPITVKFKRGSEEKSLSVTPKPVFGVYVSNFIWKISQPKYLAPWDALKEAFTVLYSVLRGLGGLVQSLFIKHAVPEEVAGPVGMAQIISFYAELGWRYLLTLVASISLNLALVNILPFPALDGGRLIFIGWEAVTRKKINPALEYRFHQIGMILLLILFFLITYQDVVRLLRR
ncbi:MAG: M50 family metallopeptidase [bacterium]|nr:M50 family metallopeptidase [bacterium]